MMAVLDRAAGRFPRGPASARADRRRRGVPMAPILGLPVSPWLLVCLGAGLVVGVLAGVNPTDGVLAALGLMFAVVAVMDLTLAFILFVVVSFMDVISSGGSFSGAKMVGLVVFVSWLARTGSRRGPALGQFISENAGLTYALVALLAWAALSYTWAADPNKALSGAGRLALVMMLVPIGFAAVRRSDQALWVVAAFIVGAVASALYGFLLSGFSGGRFVGANGDPNGEATVMAAALPLVVALYPSLRHSARLRLLAVVSLLILFLGLVETLSREGLLSLAAILVGGVIFGGRWRRQAGVLLVIAAVLTVGYYGVVAPTAARQRVTMSDTSGRSTLWTIAGRMIAAHPLLGVGNDNYIVVESRYINRPGAIAAFDVVTQPHVSHNTYLEAAADLGIPGLLMLLAILFFSLRAGVRAARTFESLGNERMDLLSRAVVLSLVGVLTTEFFVAADYAKYLWILLAFCVLLQRLARREAEAAAAAPEATGARTAPRRLLPA